MSVAIDGAGAEGLSDSLGVCRFERVLPGRRRVRAWSLVHDVRQDTLAIGLNRVVRWNPRMRVQARYLGYKVRLSRNGNVSVDQGDAIYYYGRDGGVSVGCRMPTM